MTKEQRDMLAALKKVKMRDSDKLLLGMIAHKKELSCDEEVILEELWEQYKDAARKAQIRKLLLLS